ncbi:FAD-binding oxidoreductase [Nocardia sp. NBC_01503]|uniref:FAD-binding oxidoreductase n=1 Tax=Nocardia sp. NBC_01503 TaxID=2975997 RepID=UPI002E7BF204|nr:FAD-binding oxidoreductase [Nocardia sp. NBC_01503]WTL31017.1 FAD-binding oxidoreductase [Nocardia sp. NBC_01503]
MAMNRRSLLRAAAAGAAYTALGAGALSGCMSESAARQVDWNVLRQRLAGALSLPADTDYATAKMAYNPGFDNRQPAAVARCGTAADVQACVSLASQSGTRIAARSGGHSYAGYSTPDGALIVDVGRMNSVQVGADGTAVIGAGARLMDVYSGLARAGRCLPAGSCPTVGIAGLTLGGGLGVLSGKYGLTCDSLVSAQVVTPDGVLRTASADSEPDLYWALRGGGGGNLGVVTSFTFKTVAAPQLVVFQLKFPAGTLTDVLGGWQSFTQSAPDEFWSTLGTSAGSPPTCRINGCYVGSESALNTLVDKLVAATGVQPSNRYSLSRNYLSAMMYFGGCSNYSADQCHPNWNGGGALGRESFTASSRVLNKPLSDPAKLTALLTGRTGMDILLDSMVGAPSRIGVADTAFPHRGALATAQIYVGATTPAARTAVTEVRNALGDLVGNAAYVNYIDPALSDWSSAYYGSNAPRLRRIAQKYDPHGVFTFDQSITKC